MTQPRWQSEGTEPDYRFTLANERTFLAWIRTALGVLAAGMLLDQFATNIHPRSLLVAAAFALALLAGVMAGAAYVRWKANEIAMRHAQPLKIGFGVGVLSAVMGVVALVLAVLLLVQ